MFLRYFIELSYKGKNYHGWQIQPNAISVQDVLTKSLGSSNPHNQVKATLNGLVKQIDARKMANKRGITINEIFNS